MLKLVKHPNPILNQKLNDFDFTNPVMIPEILETEMLRVMLEENGRGLAASQVNINARVFTIKTEKLEGVSVPFAVFNPQVISQSPNMQQDYEGCLSFPNLFLSIPRPEHIIVEFFDRNQQRHIIRLDDIDARCFLHELDHLDGLCFVDKVSKLKLDLATKRQRKLNGRTKQRTTTSI